jgi:hypothetical protein
MQHAIQLMCWQQESQCAGFRASTVPVVVGLKILAMHRAAAAYQAPKQYAAAPDPEGPLGAVLQLHPLLLQPLPQWKVFIWVKLWLLVWLAANITVQGPAELPLGPQCVLPLLQTPAKARSTNH